MNRAVALLRVSTPQQAQQGYSMEDQERAIRGYLQQRRLVLTELLREEGVSGKLAVRQVLERLTQLADERAVDVLVCVKLDRLGRNQRTILNTLHALESRGVRVEFVDYTFGDDKTGRFVRNVMGSVAELESDQIRERTMAGRRAKAEQGRIPAYAEPYGYHQIRKYEALAHPHYAGRDGHLEIVEAQAEVVRELYRRFAAGAALNELQLWLTQSGIASQKGRTWAVSVVRGILTQSAYAGTYYYYQRAYRAREDQLTHGGYARTTSTPRERKEQLAIPVPPIVERELWEKVQARMRDQKDFYRGRETHTYLLRGLVRCGLCRRRDGGPMSCSGGTRGNGGRAYVCASRSVSNHAWCGTFYSVRRLEAAGQAFVRQLAESDALERIIAGQLEGLRQVQAASAPSTERLEKNLAAVNARLARLVEQALEFDFPRDVVAAQNAKLCAERESIEKDLRRLRNMDFQFRQTTGRLSQIAQVRAELAARIAAAEADPLEWIPLFRSSVYVVIAKGKNPQWHLQDALLGPP